VGTVAGLIAGGGIAGTLAALPMPLGSLTEPLRPRALPGPGGMPLTPASWPDDFEVAPRTQSSATHANDIPLKDIVPIFHRRGHADTGCARFMLWRSPCRPLSAREGTSEDKRKFPSRQACVNV